MKTMHDKILFVDDEQNLLDGIKRDLFESYDITTALGGEKGLKILEDEGPFSVVVSDMRMPQMDGITFLARVMDHYPESIRVMLSGNADLDTAIGAVNEGNIFRFITKPCPTETLIKVLDTSLTQYHLLQAEKELLKNTLQGAIKVLIDILALTNPVAFSRASRIKYFAHQFASLLHIRDIWRIEVAAMLSQIGCVTIPPDTLEKVYGDKELSPDEKEMFKKYPLVGHDLIAHIPRLETVAEIIRRQQDSDVVHTHNNGQDDDVVAIGSGILQVAIDFDTLLSRGISRGMAMKTIREREGVYHPAVVAIIKDIELPEFEKKIATVKIKQLRKGMVVNEDVRTKNGALLIKKGQDVTPAVRTLLENHFRQGTIENVFLVSVPITIIENT